MNRNLNTAIRHIVVHGLILCLTVATVWAADDAHKLRVAFVGIRYTNLEKDIQDVISWRVTQALMLNEGFLLFEPRVLQMDHSSEELERLLSDSTAAAIGDFGREFDYDFVYWGQLQNDSSQEGNIHLVGTLERYQVGTRQQETFAVESDYDRFGDQLVEFRNKLISPVSIKQARPRTNVFRKILVAGLIVGGAILIRSLSGPGSGGEELEVVPESTDN